MKKQPSSLFFAFWRDRAGRKDFWIITFTALLLCAVAAKLCAWQLHRAAQKQALQTQLAQTQQQHAWGNAQLLQAPPVQANDAQTQAWAEVATLSRGLPAVSWLYQPVQLQGHWLPAHTLYLENRQMQGKTGFWVYQAFALQGSSTRLWVLRGWVMRDMRGRTLVPPLRTPNGLVRLQGQLQGQPSALSSLGADPSERTSTGAVLRLNMDWPSALQIAAPGQVLPFTVRETEAGQNDGLGRNWDAPPLGIAKHQGYAFQWAGMGLSLLLLYLWFQCWLPWRRLRQAHSAQC